MAEDIFKSGIIGVVLDVNRNILPYMMLQLLISPFSSHGNALVTFDICDILLITL